MKKLTLLGFVIALMVGLSVALSQTVLLAQQDTAQSGTAITQGSHKSKQKNKHKGKKKTNKKKSKKVISTQQ